MILPFGSLSKRSNEQAQTFAINNLKPWIATSDAHRIKDLAISWIEPKGDPINEDNEERLLNDLREKIKTSQFLNHCSYESFLGWLHWVGTFIGATKLGFDKYSIN